MDLVGRCGFVVFRAPLLAGFFVVRSLKTPGPMMDNYVVVCMNVTGVLICQPAFCRGVKPVARQPKFWWSQTISGTGWFSVCPERAAPGAWFASWCSLALRRDCSNHLWLGGPQPELRDALVTSATLSPTPLSPKSGQIAGLPASPS